MRTVRIFPTKFTTVPDQRNERKDRSRLRSRVNLPFLYSETARFLSLPDRDQRKSTNCSHPISVEVDSRIWRKQTHPPNGLSWRNFREGISSVQLPLDASRLSQCLPASKSLR